MIVSAPLPYGPQSAAIRGFLVQFAGLSADDRARVVAAHASQAETRAWMSAERQLAETVARSDRDAFRDALSGPLLQLVRRSGVEPPSTDEEALAALDPVAEAALEALNAVRKDEAPQAWLLVK